MHAEKGRVGEVPPAPQGLSGSDILFWPEKKKCWSPGKKENMRSKSKGNEHFRLGERILDFPSVYFDFDLLKMFPNVFSSQITYQTFQKEIPFQMLESKSLGCQSIQIFQLQLLTPGNRWVWELCAVAAPWQGMRMARGREWQRFAHGMALVARLVLAAPSEASPERTCILPSFPLHAEVLCEWGLDLQLCVLIFLFWLCVSSDSRRYLLFSTVPLCSSFLLTTINLS